MRTLRQALLILVVAIIAAAVQKRISPRSPAVIECDAQKIDREEICLSALNDSSENGTTLWLDARTRRDWLRDGLPGSLLLTLDAQESFDSQLAEVLPQLISHQRIIVYCSDHGCQSSREVVRRLQQYGLQQDIKALHGGWQALNAAGRIPVSQHKTLPP